jgi:ribonucleoside-diphosphate reductase alpha chain
MFIDDSACNLASLNLMKFMDEKGEFDIEAFRHAVRLTVLAQEIIVDNASYPNAGIRINSHNFRALGIGYANLGALLMSLGMPYDSDAGRAFAAAASSLLTGEAYHASALIAERIGTFPAFEQNRDPFLRVMSKHRDAASGIDPTRVPAGMWDESTRVWERVCDLGGRTGFRNAQVSVLAPTGTIGFMMDCDTTGIEPDIALVKYKQLAGGGTLKIVNQTVPLALRTLGYDEQQAAQIVQFIDKHDTIEGAAELKPEHLPVFDCAFPPPGGKRSIPWRAHVLMMAAAQPFISGAISKTVNMPKDTTPEDIAHAYREGWRLGLKALAIYRDGSKGVQPLTTKSKADRAAEKQPVGAPRRERLPDTRKSITHKFSVSGHEGYITVGLYPDGRPGELFITMAKEGSTIGGLMDCFGTAVSMSLQYGVPLEVYVNKFSHTRFEPMGYTKNPDIRIAKSIVDYIFRWLGIQFIPGYREASKGMNASGETAVAPEGSSDAEGEPPPVAMKAVGPNREQGQAKSNGSPPPGGANAAGSPRGNGDYADTGSGEDLVNPAGISTLTTVLERAGILLGKPATSSSLADQFASFQTDAPSCDQCGAITVRSGNCYLCHNCGNSMGCS